MVSQEKEPDQFFPDFEPLNLSIHVSEQLGKGWSPDFEALELWMKALVGKELGRKRATQAERKMVKKDWLFGMMGFFSFYSTR